MNFNKFKRAFSLTELLIVIVVVVVLFSAILPIMTKRRISPTATKDFIWRYVPGDTQDNAYFDDGSAIVGRKPRPGDMWQPYGKLVINANQNQNQIQFRYGEGNGNLTGLLFANQTDLGITSKLLCKTNTPSSTSCNDNFTGPYNTNANAAGNTLLGIGAASGIGQGRPTPSGLTSIGADTTKQHFSGHNNVTAIGAEANKYGGAKNSVIVGAQSGMSNPAKNSNYKIINTVAVGDHTLGLENSGAENSVILGSKTAQTTNEGMRHIDSVLIGTSYWGALPYSNTGDAYNNVLIGNNTLTSAPKGIDNTTVVGVGACESLRSTKKGPNDFGFTCIGYNSANNYGRYNATLPHAIGYANTHLDWEEDGGEHIFIGGTPNYLPGRAVLEIHNGNYGPKGLSTKISPVMGPTVVLNSNLVVRGNLYFPNNTTGNVTPHAQDPLLSAKAEDVKNNKSLWQTARDYCGKKKAQPCSNCYRWISGSKGDSPISPWTWVALGVLAIASIVFPLAALAEMALLATLMASLAYLAALSALLTVVGSLVYHALLIDPYAEKISVRPKDARSGSVMQFFDNEISTCDATKHCSCETNTYVGLGSTDNGCPNLWASSDIRLKENITENTDSIEKILLLKPYNYTFKKDLDQKQQTGVIAQELQTVFPNSVTEGENGYLQIRWDEMFFANINAVKSLDKVLDDMSKKIDTLSADIVVIGKSQKDIKSRIKSLDKELKGLE